MTDRISQLDVHNMLKLVQAQFHGRFSIYHHMVKSRTREALMGTALGANLRPKLPLIS